MFIFVDQNAFVEVGCDTQGPFYKQPLPMLGDSLFGHQVPLELSLNRLSSPGIGQRPASTV